MTAGVVEMLHWWPLQMQFFFVKYLFLYLKWHWFRFLTELILIISQLFTKQGSRKLFSFIVKGCVVWFLCDVCDEWMHKEIIILTNLNKCDVSGFISVMNPWCSSKLSAKCCRHVKSKHFSKNSWNIWSFKVLSAFLFLNDENGIFFS